MMMNGISRPDKMQALQGRGFSGRHIVGLYLTTLAALSAVSVTTALDDSGPFIPKAQHKNFGLRSLQASLTDGPQDLENICAVIQDTFKDEVHCECFGDVTSFLSISCEYVSSVCSASTCGRPILGVSLVDGNVFSSTTCIRDYTRQNKEVLGETCVSVTACEDPEDGLCECIASYQSDICRSCEICEGGKGISFDCTNINAEAMSSPCQAIDMDLDLQGAGALAGFMPEMSGLCTGLERALDNRISCDCTKASGGSYSITCKTNEVEENTALVQSTVDIVEGAVSAVTACHDETCTFLQLCADDKEQICGCIGTYEGEACSLCQVCEGRKAVKLDCSNVADDAKLNECQAVTSSYEFLPNFPSLVKDDVTPGKGKKSSAPASPTIFLLGVLSSILLGALY